MFIDKRQTQKNPVIIFNFKQYNIKAYYDRRILKLEQTTLKYKQMPPRRKKNKAAKHKHKFIKAFARQLFITIIIISILFSFRWLSPSLNNTISEALSYNIETSSLFEQASVYIKKIYTFIKSSGIKNAIITIKNKLPQKHQNIDYSVYAAESDLLDYSMYAEKIQDEASQASIASGNKKFIMPVNGKLESSFGNRIHPIKKKEELHKGIDIAANNGDSIKAALDGIVIEAQFEASYGNYVKIKHDETFTTLYAHCSKLLVKKGDKVDTESLIALVGATGEALGPHLHFEVRKNGACVDPLEYVKDK